MSRRQCEHRVEGLDRLAFLPGVVQLPTAGGGQQKDRGGFQSPGGLPGGPNGPSRSRAALWDAHSGTLTPARYISLSATRKKWLAARSSTTTTTRTRR